jgi:hypothetical protein
MTACILIIASCPRLSQGKRDTMYVKTVTLGEVRGEECIGRGLFYSLVIENLRNLTD